MSTLYNFFPSSSLYSCFLCFCWFLSASYSQSVPDLTTCLELSCQLPSLKTWTTSLKWRENLSFFFSFFLCVCEVLTSQLPSCMNGMRKYSKQLCDIGLTLKLLNICFCFIKTLNIPSFILATFLHAKNQEN